MNEISTQKFQRSLSAALVLLLMAACVACGDDVTQPEVSSDEPEASATAPAGEVTVEEPDYAAAFPQDRVARLDIKISAADWQVMLDDMTALVGGFGERMGPGPGGPGGPAGGPPPELAEACVGLEAGAECSATLGGMPSAGTCNKIFGDELLCLPEGGPRGPGGMNGGTSDLIGATPIYVECEVATDDRTWSHVGVRFKGNSSLSMPWGQGVWKLPLRLQFDEFEAQYPETHNQRFYGFKNLSLSNSSMDQSLLREKLGTDVFSQAGIAAPSTAFYRVYIDHGEGPKYFGLYTGIELPSDNPFLDSHFGGHEGNLYKPDGTGATWSAWVQESFEKETNETAADYSDVKAAFDALHADRSDAAAWRAGLEAVFDVELFLHWLALNTVVQDWDQYGRMSHNYYLYANPNAEGKLQWIPWDHSFAFTAGGGIGGGALSLSLSEVTDTWPLIRFLLDDPHYRARYHAYLAQASEREYTPEIFSAAFVEARELIEPYVTGPEGEQPGYTFLRAPDAFPKAVDELIAHVTNRQAEVKAYLETVE